MMIKTLNNLSPSFETFLTVKNNDARNTEKLPDLDEFITSVEQKENRMNLTSINLARVGDDNNNNRDSRNNRDRGGERDTNSNNDSTATLCKKCYTSHLPDNDNCPNKDEICDNLNCERSRDHKGSNCSYPEESRHKEYLAERRERFNNTPTSTSTSSSTPSTPKAHIDTIQMSINRLRSNHSSPST